MNSRCTEISLVVFLELKFIIFYISGKFVSDPKSQSCSMFENFTLRLIHYVAFARKHIYM